MRPPPKPDEAPTAMVPAAAPELDSFKPPLQLDFDLKGEQDRVSRYARIHEIADRLGPKGLALWQAHGELLVDILGDGT